MTGLLAAIQGHARAGMTNVAFDDGKCPLGWAEAGLAVANTAADVGRLDPSRPVGALLDHSTASAILLLAFLEAGVPIIPLPPFFNKAQCERALDDAGAVGLVTSCELAGDRVSFAMHPRQATAVRLPEGSAVISFSSGSTAEPKGVCISAAHLETVASAVCDYLGWDLAGRHLPILPFGILLEQVAGLFASMIVGGTYVPLAGRQIGMENPLRPDGRMLLEAVARSQASSLILVPEYLSTLVAAIETSGIALPHLNLVAVGGASIGAGLLARAKAVGLPVRQGYGMTETGSVIALEDAARPSNGSVGASIGAHRLILADDGEIVVEGPLYLGLVGTPRAPGPFATGDLGRFDEHGQLWIEGRKSNLIVTSFGRNVSPEWIEGLLLAEPEIAQTMVRGDAQSALEALIVPAAPNADVRSAVDRVNEALPPYARVAAFSIVPPFTPANGLLTGNGRLRRKAIEAAYPQASGPKFYDRLVHETREEQGRFAMTPQLIAGFTGQITRGDYIAYLTQAFHHVRHTVPLMVEARAKLAGQGKQFLVDALDEYVQEETGHENWIFDDIRAAGGDPDAAVAQGPSPATKAMVDHAYHVIRTGNPAAFFGMVFVLEGTSVAMASTGAATIEHRLGLPKTAFRYLYSHGSLDQDHMNFFERLMNRIEDPADQDAIVAMAKEMFGLFGGLFASIELEGTRHAA